MRDPERIFTIFQPSSRDHKDHAQRVAKQRTEFSEITESMLERARDHEAVYNKSREPLLDHVSSNYDLSLFREAQARACEDKVFKLQPFLSSPASGACKN